LVHAPPAHPPLPSFPTRRSSDLYRHGAAPDEVLPDDVIVLRHGDPILDLHPPGRIVNGHVGLAIEARIQIAGRRSYAAANFYLRSEEHTSELQSRENLVCRLLLE